jgi:hypothetical protein
MWPEGRRLIHEKMTKFKKTKKTLPPISRLPNTLRLVVFSFPLVMTQVMKHRVL